MTTFRSNWPDVVVPDITIPQLLFSSYNWNHCDDNKVLFIDAITGKGLKYGELLDMVKKIGKGLHNSGLRKGNVAAIFLPNTIYYPPIFHAILAVGGVATTANPQYTAEEFAKQLDDSQPRFIFTIPEFLEKTIEAAKNINLQTTIVIIGQSALKNTEKQQIVTLESLMKNDGELPQVPIKPTDLAILPYSSGTTGLPKGVMLEHKSVVANVHQLMVPDAASFVSDAMYSVVIPMFHIYGLVYFLHMALFRRLPCVVFPRFDLQMFLEAIQKYKITHTNIVPPIVVLLAKNPLVDKYDLSSLRVINSGAAPLSSELQQLVLQRLKLPVRQGYGMSETPTATLVSPYFPGVIPRLGSSGMLLPNVEAKIISTDNGKLLGVGEEGELCFRCPNMMRGYYKRESENIIDKDGFIHTGDVGYVDSDGYFFVVDRVKELIKYNGFQVAPAELEALLLKHPKVMDVAVIGRPDMSAGELPTAFVVAKPNTTATSTELAEHVAPHVAHYKQLRGGVVFIDQIPKSASGKILRRLLRDKLKADAKL